MWPMYQFIQQTIFISKQVESEDTFERVGGSSIGGGTFWGLGALLTKTKVKPLFTPMLRLQAQ